MNELILAAEEAYMKGRSQEAVGLLAKVLAAEPDNLRALSNIGVIFHAVSQFQDAKTAFEKILTMEPENNGARKNLVLSLLSLKEFAEAKSHLEKLLAANQNEYQLWSLLSKVEEALNNKQAAAAHAERSLLLNPEQPEIRRYLETLKAGGATAARTATLIPGRKKNLFIFSAPETESETDVFRENLSENFKLERIASVKMELYKKSIPYADIIYLDGLSPVSLYFLAEKEFLRDKTVFLRVSRDDMLSGVLSKAVFETVNHVCFETFYYRDVFMSLQPALTPGANVHVIRRAVDVKTYAYSPREGKNNVCSVLSPSATAGDLILLLEAFFLISRENPEAVLRIHPGERDMTKEKYFNHFVAVNGLAGKVFFHSGQSLKNFLEQNDCILLTEVNPGVKGMLEALVFGLKPLIRFTVAQNEYSPEYALWKNMTELSELYQNPPDARKLSETIGANNGPEKISPSYVKILTGGSLSA
jgi:tetratricopeptide (TPR) repeat protein